MMNRNLNRKLKIRKLDLRNRLNIFHNQKLLSYQIEAQRIEKTYKNPRGLINVALPPIKSLKPKIKIILSVSWYQMVYTWAITCQKITKSRIHKNTRSPTTNPNLMPLRVNKMVSSNALTLLFHNWSPKCLKYKVCLRVTLPNIRLSQKVR